MILGPRRTRQLISALVHDFLQTILLFDFLLLAGSSAFVMGCLLISLAVQLLSSDDRRNHLPMTLDVSNLIFVRTHKIPTLYFYMKF